ncbi:MAG: SPOR domain-containing protein [Sphingomonadales bacterium]|nr:SPOR domain-containing protein [Sphingomonadales bacterium]
MGAVLTGCSGVDLTRLSPASSADQLAHSARKSSDDYQRLAAKGDVERALAAAEAAVAADPANGAYRSTLGQAYFSAGRFASAATAFDDAMALGQADGRTAVSLALALAAIGDSDRSVAVLDEHRDRMSASDYGLALALAGQPERAVMVLVPAARQDDATAQTRQNLAFAYAMTNHWLEAKLVAAQDMNIANLDARMTEWAALAQAPTSQMRVAGLMGITPVADPGLPVRLALVDGPGAQAVLAAEAVSDMTAYDYAAAPAPASDYAVASPMAMAYSDVQPAEGVAAEASDDEAEPYRAAVAELLALDQSAEQRPVQSPQLERVAAAAPRQMVSAPMIAADAAPASKPAPVKASKAWAKSGWAVQLGAFSSNGAAQRAWSQFSGRYGALDGYDAASHFAKVGGRDFYRLTANGLGSRGEAVALCNKVKASGGVCFVRNLSGGEDYRWASRDTGTRLASR